MLEIEAYNDYSALDQVDQLDAVRVYNDSPESSDAEITVLEINGVPE